VNGDRLASVVDTHSRKILALAEKARTAETVLNRTGAGGEERPLDALLSEVVETVRSEHPTVSVELTGVPDEPVQCQWLLSVVVENLVENAAMHNTAADPRVAVEATTADDDLVVTVSDNGPGIPEMEVDVVRSRGETATHHGQGIGLWLVAWAVDRLGGTVSFERPPEGGTTVTVRVPRTV
jgi:signal transduction histidine kinase